MNLDQLKDIGDIAESVATVVAIIVGGFWSYALFVRKRQRYPRANIKHRIKHKAIADNKLLLHVEVTISNSGDVLLSFVSGETRIQQVLPPERTFLDSINQGRDPVRQGETEVRWPQICARRSEWQEAQLEIEPGESDQLHYDFILDAGVQTIEVYSHFRNVKKRGREMGWGVTTVYDFRP